VEYARILGNLSNVLRDLGENEVAKQGYLKVLEIKKISFGEDHILYSNTLENLSCVLKD
jgi:hypothetical protein